MHPPNRYLQCERYWPAVLKIIGAFSSRHLQQVLLLCHNLGLQFSDDGLPRHVLTRPQDVPLLDQHLWLLDDWAIPQSPARAAFEKHLFIAATFTFLALQTKTSRLDPHSFFDAGYQSLEDELFRQADLHWKLLFDDASPFWAHYRLAHEAAFPALSPADSLTATGHWAFAALPAIATALWAGKAPLIPQLVSFSEECRVALQIVDNLATFRRDLKNGLVTYPIQRALAAMGVTDTANTSIETALGALLLTGTLGKLLKENEARIAAARDIAGKLGLPTLQAYCTELDALMLRVRTIFSPQLAQTPAQETAVRGFFVPAPDVLGNVLLKAEAYLLADLSFREAWDIQQHSYTSAQRIIGQFFPASLVIDILCRHGHGLSAAIDGVLKTLQANGFRYWDHVDLIVPDADTIALGIRLIPHASHPEAQWAVFQTPLRWMREHQMPSGQIPVWFRSHDSPPFLSDLVVLYGADCATVETNLLVSLISTNWHGYRDVIEACARSWCQRWLDVGLAACEHYTPLYSLWAGTELVTQLSARTADEALKAQLQAVGAYINERLCAEAKRVDISPQDAAFLTLASLRTQALPLNTAWITTMFKHQRQDGCWEGEPIYIVPTARNLTTTWFKSRTITTAFAYHALKHYHAYLQDRQAK
jgi:hypothetical protein